MSQLVALKNMHEEQVRVTIENWDKVKLLIAYKYLHARGCSLESIDFEIDRALREELKGSE